MDRGYLKLWRKSLESEVFASEPLWRLWSWCLMKTTHKEKFVPLKIGKGSVTVRLNPGQFVFGRNRAAECLGDSPSTVWKRMKKLEEMQNIQISSDNQYSIVSICNWEEYQMVEDKKEQPSDNQVTTKEQLSDTNNNNKNNKNNKGEKFDVFSFRPEWISEDHWKGIVIHRRKHKAKPPETKAAFQGIVKQLTKAIEDGYTFDECYEAWIENSSWQGFKAVWMKPEYKNGHSHESVNCEQCGYKLDGDCPGGKKECQSYSPR